MPLDESGDPLVDQLLPVLIERVERRAVASIELVAENLALLGPLHRDESSLLAGERVLNDERELLPRLARALNLGICIYLGNRRIASTTTLEAGPAPELREFAEALLVDTVLRRGETFRGPLDTRYGPMLSVCRPLYAGRDQDMGGPVGMLEVFQNLGVLRDSLAGSLQESHQARTGGAEDRAEVFRELVALLDDVSRRLQLLALNGNILAAQAGEHGRAFRVVFRELGSLADRSKEAAARYRSSVQIPGSPGSALDVGATQSQPETGAEPPSPQGPAEDQ